MQRPLSLTIFGILNIVFGAFGVFGTLGSIPLLFAQPNSDNPVIKTMQEQPPAYMAFLKTSVVIGFFATLFLIAIGIGLLKMKNWARHASIFYGIYAIISGITAAVMNFVFIVRPLLASMNTSNQGPMAFVPLITGAATIFGSLVGLLYPILMIVFITRPSLIAKMKVQQNSGPETRNSRSQL